MKEIICKRFILSQKDNYKNKIIHVLNDEFDFKYDHDKLLNSVYEARFGSNGSARKSWESYGEYHKPKGYPEWAKNFIIKYKKSDDNNVIPSIVKCLHKEYGIILAPNKKGVISKDFDFVAKNGDFEIYVISNSTKKNKKPKSILKKILALFSRFF